MAGSYPDVPAPKIYFSINGSVVVAERISDGVIAAVTPAQATALDGEVETTNSNGITSAYRLIVVFPHLVDLAGVYMRTNGAHIASTDGVLRTSTNSTNGADGTWTTASTNLPVWSVSDPGAYLWRTGIVAVNLPGIRAVSLSTASAHAVKRTFHLYGRPSDGQGLDKLAFWHPTLDEPAPAAHFDYGNQSRGATQTVQFRVRNISSDLTAQSIVLATSAITPSSPTLASQTTFSLDNSTYTASLDLGNLAPATTSPVLYARLGLVATAQSGPWRQRFAATAASWS